MFQGDSERARPHISTGQHRTSKDESFARVPIHAVSSHGWVRYALLPQFACLGALGFDDLDTAQPARIASPLAIG